MSVQFAFCFSHLHSAVIDDGRPILRLEAWVLIQYRPITCIEHELGVWNAKKKSQKETELLPWKHNVIYTEFQGPSNLIQSAFRNKKNQWMNKIDTFDQICTDKVLVRYNDIIIRNSSSIFTCPSFNWRFSEPAQSIIHDKNSNMKWNSNGNIRRSMIIEDF